MDTSISRIDDDNEAPAFTSLRLDALDILASLAVRHGPLDDESLAILSKVSAKERIYVALAAGRIEILHSLNLTIAEAIDRLGWADASAMVARWRNRRA